MAQETKLLNICCAPERDLDSASRLLHRQPQRRIRPLRLMHRFQHLLALWDQIQTAQASHSATMALDGLFECANGQIIGTCEA